MYKVCYSVHYCINICTNLFTGGEILQTLGNHEFDNGIDGLVPFLDNVTFPVINCNIDTSKEPKLQGKFNRSVVLNVNGQKIGVIGYITEETDYISNPGM